ncbi:carboxylesterase family protein [Staphylococcus felis]|uniref:carboxylesterase family protein n=1 Tax=Staphylococcus felis TaxID=46127 RepID=UPI0039677DCD
MCLVHTKLGYVKGERRTGYDCFKGIPYAKPPIGALRFLHAHPIDQWQGVLDATQWSDIPIQPHNSLERFFAVTDHQYTQNEDCLYLNIWRPNRKVTHPLPVIIYIYGGSFLNGHSAQDLYQPHEMVKQEDVIVVTLNYRIGALGFLDWSTMNSDWDKNNGLSDQICAIQWVHQYIEAFGGHPNHISLMGQSAGAMSIEALLRISSVRPLIKNAILLSGILKMDSLEDGNQKAHEFSALKTKHLGARDFETLSSSEMLFLMEKHQEHYGKSKGLELLYQPIETEHIDSTYHNIRIPILLSITKSEGDIYIANEHKRLPPAQFQAVIQRAGLKVPQESEIQTAQQQRDFITTYYFKKPFQNLYETLSQYTTVWTYEFTWAHPTHPDFATPYHILDVIFWMGRLDILTAHGAYVSDRDKQLSRHMMRKLCHFVQTGKF